MTTRLPAKPERRIMAAVLRALDPATERLFRINAGTGWTGKIVKHTGDMIMMAEPRPLHAAPTGWPDLCGWRAVTITQDMVGKTLAVFRGVEIKAGSDRLRPQQRRFMDVVLAHGGLFEVIDDDGISGFLDFESEA